jgi:hypothetical protein
MNRCDCCERPLHKDEQTFWADDDATLCAKCAFGLLVRERDAARRQLEAARGLAQAITEAQPPTSLDGIREVAAEIVTLLDGRTT